ncbi:MAG: hypothetical protein MZV64_67955 [Ignavibacteriales bacterium]|nr:hypothetical protein [Ignavibacteriales bacterium]
MRPDASTTRPTRPSSSAPCSSAGTTRFDPRDHHGPTLYFLTLPAARLLRARTLAGLDMAALRAVPALAGAARPSSCPPARGGLSREAVLAAAALAAFSPATGLLQPLLYPGDAPRRLPGRLPRRRLALHQDPIRPVGPARGVAAGLMAATKETGVILSAAAAAAWPRPRLRNGSTPGPGDGPPRTGPGPGAAGGPAAPERGARRPGPRRRRRRRGPVLLLVLRQSRGSDRCYPRPRAVVRAGRPSRRPRPSLALLFRPSGLREGRDRARLERGLPALPGPGRGHRRPGPRRRPGRFAALPALHALLHPVHGGGLQPHPLQDALEPPALLSGARPSGRPRRRPARPHQPVPSGQAGRPGPARSGLRRFGRPKLPGRHRPAGRPRQSLRLRPDESPTSSVSSGTWSVRRRTRPKGRTCSWRSSPRRKRPGPCRGTSAVTGGSAIGRARRPRAKGSERRVPPSSFRPPPSPRRSARRSARTIG